MAEMTFDQMIIKTLENSLTKRIEEIRAEVVKDAVEEFTRQVREADGNSAINLANFYSVERMGANLLIRVQIEKL
jgi:hypothetical protein